MSTETLKNREYDYLVKQATPNSKSIKNTAAAFLVGGAICALGQAFMYVYGTLIGIPEDDVPTVVAITLIGLSILITGLNVYDNIAKFAGAGTLVPITGFANAMAAASLEFKSEGLILGVGAKMFLIAGPVIVYGELASVIYGLIIHLFGLI